MCCHGNNCYSNIGRSKIEVQQALQTGKWDKSDHELAPYYELRAEIYMADGLLRNDRIIPPETLRDKIITIAHRQGHLGKTKTKEMIRKKYWFPMMNQQIENIVSKCVSCQVATNVHHTEPGKMTELPKRPWETVEIDFCGPFPNHEYALVVTDQYSRYADVEFVRSTSIQPTHRKLKKILATHGVPKNRAIARTLIGGCIFIYSCSARRVSFQIKCKFMNLKRNLSGKT